MDITNPLVIPKYIALKEKLKHDILTGTYPCGKQLPTQHDLIRRYKVSYATVSRALQELVKEGVIIRERGRGTFVADRPLAGLNIAFVMWTEHKPLTHPAFIPFLSGIQDVISSNGCSLKFINIDKETLEEDKFAETILRANLDGLIIPSSPIRYSDIAGLKGCSFPIVFVNKDYPDISPYIVLFDIRDGASRVFRHFLRNGHRKIALLVHSGDPRFINEILDVFGEETAKAGVDFEPVVLDVNYTWESGYKATGELLKMRPRPTAILAADDFVAAGAIKCIHEKGLSVPGDVSVVGIGDTQVANIISPPLSSLKIPFSSIGEKAATYLCRALRREHFEPETIVIQGKLVVRKSSGPAPKK